MCKCRERAGKQQNAASRATSFNAFTSSEDSSMNEPVSLNLKSSVVLPQTVVLPLRLHRHTGVNRRLTITRRDQEVPKGVREWMQRDPRYADWFEEVGVGQHEQVIVSDAAAAPADANERWSAEMRVDQLRAYAKRHNVAIESTDTKGPIIEKLRAARGTFEDGPKPAES